MNWFRTTLLLAALTALFMGLGFMLGDSRAPVLVTKQGLADALPAPGVTLLYLDAVPRVHVPSADTRAWLVAGAVLAQKLIVAR